MSPLEAALLAAGYLAGETFELCAIRKTDGRGAGPRAFRQLVLEHEDASAWIATEDGAPAEFNEGGLYLSTNPVTPGRGRAEDPEVTQIRLLLVDLDPEDATPEARAVAVELAAEVLALLEQRLGVRPAVVNSGRGRQLWLRHEPPGPGWSIERVGDLRKRALHALGRRFERAGAKVDKGVHNPSRLMRLPGTTNLRTRERAELLDAGDGKVAELARLEALVVELERELAAKAPPPKAPTAPAPRALQLLPADDEAARVRAALRFVRRVDDYEGWLGIGMALHAWGDPQAEALWAEWSQGSPKFDAAVQAEKWASFNGDGGVTLGTVFALAKDGGWDPLELERGVVDTAIARLATDAGALLAPEVLRALARIRRQDASEAARLRERVKAAKKVKLEDLDKAIEREGKQQRAAERGAPGKKGTPAARTILVDEKVHETIAAAEAALADHGTDLYHRSGELVHVVPVKAAPTIRPLRVAALLPLCSAAASWIELREIEGEVAEVPAKPPRDVVEGLAAQGRWPRLRHLTEVVEAPTLRPDGSVLDTPGYDAASGLLFVPARNDWLRVPDRPTRADAEAALEQLRVPFLDFPFVTPDDQAAALALPLTLLGRPAVSGPVPAFGVSAREAGSGKGLLVDVASLIALGRAAPLCAPVLNNDDEERKQLHTWATEGRPFMVIDNVKHELGSEALNSAITSNQVDGRVLGRSRSGGGRPPLIAATGNNLRVKGDMARRTLLIGLDAGVERPDQRDGFVLGDEEHLRTYVFEQRPQLVTACLTILRWHLGEGLPQPPLTPFGSFGGWARLVRAALVNLGAGDPVASQQRLHDHGDPRREAEGDLFRLWFHDRGLPPLATARQVVERADDVRALRDAIVALDPRAQRDGLDATRFARELSKLDGTIRSGLRLTRGRKDGHLGVTWRVERVGAAPPDDDR